MNEDFKDIEIIEINGHSVVLDGKRSEIEKYTNLLSQTDLLTFAVLNKNSKDENIKYICRSVLDKRQK